MCITVDVKYNIVKTFENIVVTSHVCPVSRQQLFIIIIFFLAATFQHSLRPLVVFPTCVSSWIGCLLSHFLYLLLWVLTEYTKKMILTQPRLQLWPWLASPRLLVWKTLTYNFSSSPPSSILLYHSFRSVSWIHPSGWNSCIYSNTIQNALSFSCPLFKCYDVDKLPIDPKWCK